MGNFKSQRNSEVKASFQELYELDVSFKTEISLFHSHSNEERIRSWRYLYLKRWIDLMGASVLAALSILPAVVIALAIAITSHGPVFYTETRIGRNKRPFRIWKFRSMCQSAPWQEVVKANPASGVLLHWRIHKRGCDPRITPVGGFLRRWSLDELPQVINVLLGDMSLIGPRPVTLEEVPLYGELQHYYLAATPGLSGLWQVSGRSDVGFAERAHLDAFYVQNWSLRYDFSILLRTIPTVLGRVGAK